MSDSNKERCSVTVMRLAKIQNEGREKNILVVKLTIFLEETLITFFWFDILHIKQAFKMLSSQHLVIFEFLVKMKR